MLSFIDRQLNKIAMYRLTIYSLLLILGGAFFLACYGVISVSPFALLFSIAFILSVSVVSNNFLANYFNSPANVESVYITALILSALIPPPQSTTDWKYYALAFWASVWSMASKYVFAIEKKHIFNPGAFGVAIVSLALGISATWWVGSIQMLPFVAVAGFLLVRKINRTDLVVSFLVTALLAIIIPVMQGDGNGFTALLHTITNSPIIFFACIMLTEPLTTPPTRGTRILYGIVTGILFAPWVHFGTIWTTPEIALLIGNIVSYGVGSKTKLFLKLKRMEIVASDTGDFIFTSDKKLQFKPGQYVEWTLPHEDPDDRGFRRYFTIASSPTEKEIHLGVKFYDPPSTFKARLINMVPGDRIIASQLSGDFTLPRNKKQKLVFIAGGIGITPFRSMIKYLSDTGEKRDIILLYGNRTEKDIAYQEIFDEAKQKFGLRTIHCLSDLKNISPGWKGEKGSINAEIIKRNIPDYKTRHFYLSGPHQMVVGIETTLKQIGVPSKNIKTDYFPGF